MSDVRDKIARGTKTPSVRPLRSAADGLPGDNRPKIGARVICTVDNTYLIDYHEARRGTYGTVVGNYGGVTPDSPISNVMVAWDSAPEHRSALRILRARAGAITAAGGLRSLRAASCGLEGRSAFHKRGYPSTASRPPSGPCREASTDLDAGC